jgi:hypothetical protein
MKKINYLFLSSLLVLLLVITYSCNKTVPNTNINIVSPISGYVYEHGDTVFINGTLTSDLKMYGYKLTIKNTSNSDQIVFTKQINSESNEYIFNEYWINDVSNNSTMKLELDNFNKKGNSVGTFFITFNCNK